MFPDLEKEIDEARRDMKNTKTDWPDQTAEAYKKHLEKTSELLLGREVSAAQKDTFMVRIMRRFSTCFWVAGCLAPQVMGYSASIQRMLSSLWWANCLIFYCLPTSLAVVAAYLYRWDTALLL